MRSLPLWERGLKFAAQLNKLLLTLSLPLWERGLKSAKEDDFYAYRRVAPLVGAWIEIFVAETERRNIKRRSPCGSVD